eukprot:scaffold566_cov364-Pavlova_lutheri.AAC.27
MENGSIFEEGGPFKRDPPKSLLVTPPTTDFDDFCTRKNGRWRKFWREKEEEVELFLSPSVGDRRRRTPPPEGLKKGKGTPKNETFKRCRKSGPGMFGPCWTRRASVPRGEGWNPIYESFKVHTQKTGRNVLVKQDLLPLKQGLGALALKCPPVILGEPPVPIERSVPTSRPQDSRVLEGSPIPRLCPGGWDGHKCVNPQLIVLYIGQSGTMTFGPSEPP